MSPAGRVALSGSAGALVGAVLGGTLAMAGAAIAGQRSTTNARKTAILIGVVLGAAAGAASLGAIVEHSEHDQKYNISFPPAGATGQVP